MPLQNRVTPFGDIISTPHRGLLTGNRGIIHHPDTRTLLKRRWTSKAWIICRCDFKGRRRKVMAAQSWTELFFLDEATALAAGHRPCFFCRRAEAETFQTAWAAGQRRDKPRASEIDEVLHAERLVGRTKRLHDVSASISEPPNGAMIESGGESYLILNGHALLWSPAGYQRVTAPPGTPMLLTPPSTVAALQAGYCPMLHPSAKTAIGDA